MQHENFMKSFLGAVLMKEKSSINLTCIILYAITFAPLIEQQTTNTGSEATNVKEEKFNKQEHFTNLTRTAYIILVFCVVLYPWF